MLDDDDVWYDMLFATSHLPNSDGDVDQLPTFDELFEKPSSPAVEANAFPSSCSAPQTFDELFEKPSPPAVEANAFPSSCSAPQTFDEPASTTVAHYPQNATVPQHPMFAGFIDAIGREHVSGTGSSMCVGIEASNNNKTRVLDLSRSSLPRPSAITAECSEYALNWRFDRTVELGPSAMYDRLSSDTVELGPSPLSSYDRPPSYDRKRACYDDPASRRQKRQRRRMRWTAELQEDFLRSVRLLGGPSVATPFAIQKAMTFDLTLGQVKSHLQRHRGILLCCQ